jgi:phosphohistidine phosphatase
MITLYLLRHAKSSHAGNGGDDKARPLNVRGRHAATMMGRHMRDAGFQPSHVFCSIAERTRETLEILGAAAGWAAHDPSRDFVDQLYLATPGVILSVLQNLDETIPAALVIGHNPGIHELACSLAEPRGELYQQLLETYPTGALTVLTTLTEKWSTIGATPMALGAFDQPRTLVG